jgi:alpha-beta hydrolase superfamily lysophospholipase
VVRKNRQGARLKAADQLAAQLERQTSENPDAAHFVVGHSHGGSVALYSMLKSGIAEKIDGVICLSTPFI